MKLNYLASSSFGLVATLLTRVVYFSLRATCLFLKLTASLIFFQALEGLWLLSPVSLFLAEN